jgi:imidazolonepropionase-like amidohydrolase
MTPTPLRIAALLALALSLVAGACTGAPRTIPRLAEGVPVTAFTRVNVLPMEREEVLRDQTVLVQGERIVAVGPSARLGVPPGATVIDGRGRYLMPGLAEMHAHMPGGQAPPDQVERILFLYVANGITTIRGMLGAPAQLPLRERLAAGELLGPTFIVGAPSLNGTSAPDPETARRLVREHHAAGYDFLKLHPGLSRDAYDAIVAEGRRAGITWAGHVSAGVGLEHTLATRQSTIDHLDGYLEAAIPEPLLARVRAGDAALGEWIRGVDAERVRSLAARTHVAGVWNVPTMYLWENFHSYEEPEAFLAQPEMRYATPQMRSGWAQQKRNMMSGFREAGVTAGELAMVVQRRREILKALADAGAPLLLGTDSPQMLNVPGFSLHHELRVMAAAGLSPFQILESGTRNVGLYVGRDLGGDGRFGTVTEGARADLILLEANPLEAVENVARRAGVMVRGRWLAEEEIQRRLAEIAEAHAG